MISRLWDISLDTLDYFLEVIGNDLVDFYCESYSTKTKNNNNNNNNNNNLIELNKCYIPQKIRSDTDSKEYQQLHLFSESNKYSQISCSELLISSMNHQIWEIGTVTEDNTVIYFLSKLKEYDKLFNKLIIMPIKVNDFNKKNLN